VAITDPEQGTSPILVRRRLASGLRRLRKAAGLNIGEAAEELCCSTAKVSRLETGQVAATVGDVSLLLDLYEVRGEERERLLRMARQARQREDWWREYRDDPNLRAYISLEQAAISMRIYQLTSIPALLQVEEYARLVISANLPNLSREQVERQVRLRMSRREILRRADPPSIEIVLDEATLRRLEGHRGLQQEQVRRLLEVGAMPNVTVQIIPFRLGPHGGMAGPFRIFRFPGSAYPEVVFLEHPPGDTYLDNPAQVAQYCALFERLRSIALDPADSATFLDGILRESQPNRR
jgi:transcriptional regulator with XRE-family HTH domain